MQPAVRITKQGERNFNACVGVGDGTWRYECEGMPSIADCLHDAAEALGSEFPYATVIYDRTTIGSYPIAVMGHRAIEVADELLMRHSNRRTDA